MTFRFFKYLIKTFKKGIKLLENNTTIFITIINRTIFY